MTSQGRSIAVVAVLVALVAWWFLRDRDEAEIRGTLERLAEVVGKREGTEKLAFLGKALALDEMFTSDCHLRYARKGRQPVDLRGRDSVKGLYIQVYRRVKVFEVVFEDVKVELAPDRHRATVLLTARVDRRLSDGATVVDVGELRFAWRKVEGEWYIAAVEWVQVFK